jgi:hypothetical protein
MSNIEEGLYETGIAYPTIQRQCQQWAHKIQDENKQSRDTVNIGHTRYRMETNNPETMSTLGTQDTG